MGVTREGKFCSFCGTPGGPGTDVPLLGGLGAQICRGCVDDFHGVLHDDERLAAARRTMPWDTMSDVELLATLPRILGSAEQNADFAQEWVDLLRQRGISWSEIGRTLGVSRQAAWARFSKKATDSSITA